LLRRPRLTQGCSAERKEGRHTVARKIYIKLKKLSTTVYSSVQKLYFFLLFCTAPERTPKDYNENSHSYIKI